MDQDRRTLSRTVWFGFGALSAWISAFNLAAIWEKEPGAWNSVEGIVSSNLGSVFIAVFVSLPFAAWHDFRVRRLGRIELRRSWVPLSMGLTHPLFAPLLGYLLMKLIDPGRVGWIVPATLAMFTLLGHPVLSAEVAIRWEREGKNRGNLPSS